MHTRRSELIVRDTPLRAARPYGAAGPQTARAGFTLVELLVVIIIIALLAGILTPGLMKARDLSYNAKSRSIIHELSAGAMAYQKDTGYYPGQKDTGRLGSSASTVTGSQMLAACLLGELDASSGYTLTGTPGSEYVSYKADKVFDFDLKDASGNLIRTYNYTLSDGFSSTMPILYYPSRLGNDGSIAEAFVFNDNEAYTGDVTDTVDAFYRTIWDRRFGEGGNDGETPPTPDVPDPDNKAYKSDSFLLIGAGIDREFFTADDVKNF